MTNDYQQQAAALQAEIARQEAEAGRLEAEIVGLERELAEFRQRYDKLVGVAQTRLDAARAAVEELEHRRWQEQFADARPLESWTQPGDYVPVEEQYRRVWEQPPPPPVPSASPKPLESEGEREARLKHLYRALARRYHPDYAKDDIDRQYRTRLMTLINEAYQAQDVDALATLAAQPESVMPDMPLAVLRLRGLKQAALELAERLGRLRNERDRLLNHDLMKLKVDEKLAKAKGRDLLREMAEQMDKEYWALMAKLDRLRNG